MKVILVNGSMKEFGSTNFVLEQAKEQLEKNNIEAEIFWIGDNPISGCIGCNKCKLNKRCYINDKVNEFLEKAEKANAFIFATPIHFAAISGSLSSFMDRAFYIKKSIFANKAVASITVQRRAGGTSGIDEMNKYFLMSNMILVGSQYWNIVYGANKEEIKKDKEGLQTVRTLCNNMTWILNCIKEGEKVGIKLPINEEVIKTNFISN